MAKMRCGKCDNTMRDHDGSIVYDIISAEIILKIIKLKGNIKTFKDFYEAYYYDYFAETNVY